MNKSWKLLLAMILISWETLQRRITMINRCSMSGFGGWGQAVVCFSAVYGSTCSPFGKLKGSNSRQTRRRIPFVPHFQFNKLRASALKSISVDKWPALFALARLALCWWFTKGNRVRNLGQRWNGNWNWKGRVEGWCGTFSWKHRSIETTFNSNFITFSSDAYELTHIPLILPSFIHQPPQCKCKQFRRSRFSFCFISSGGFVQTSK